MQCCAACHVAIVKEPLMRRIQYVRSTLIALVSVIFCVLPIGVSQAVGVPFRGADDDHYWDVTVVYCKDAVRIAGDELMHPPGTPQGFIMGDELKFSLVLSRTSTLLITSLPIKMATSNGIQPRELLHTTVAYSYATPKTAGTALDVTIERWEHGVDSTDENEAGDNSPDDDIQVVAGTVANCTAASNPQFDSPPTPLGGQSANLTTGTPYSFTIQASDADAHDATVSFTATGLPAGATLTPNLTGNPASTTLNWTPGLAQTGIYTINVTAHDPTGRSSVSYPVTLQVQASTGGSFLFLPLVKK